MFKNGKVSEDEEIAIALLKKGKKTQVIKLKQLVEIIWKYQVIKSARNISLQHEYKKEILQTVRTIWETS